eukprot:scaffold2542_cov325-Prasinococcus_capsulatus_cf.AAC.1
MGESVDKWRGGHSHVLLHRTEIDSDTKDEAHEPKTAKVGSVPTDLDERTEHRLHFCSTQHVRRRVIEHLLVLEDQFSVLLHDSVHLAARIVLAK